MIIGILGVGHLGKILAEALLRAGHPPQDLLLAPRGKSRTLAEAHGMVLAESSADLVARADLVLLAVRPRDAVAAVEGLPWRAGQMLVSACAGVPLAVLRALLPPGVALHRIMPLTAASLGASPTTLFPPDAGLERLLAAFGPVIVLGSEAQFETATVSAAVYGWVQRLVQLTADWSEARGMAPEAARQLVALTTVAAGRNIADNPQPMPQLMAALVTPGGITERGLEVLEQGGALQSWLAACQAVQARLEAPAAAAAAAAPASTS